MPSKHAEDEVAVILTDDEAEMLREGFRTWGGPGHPSDALAQAIGFRNVESLLSIGYDLVAQLQPGRVILTRRNWTRALLSLEISFGSDVGAGYEWSIVTRFTDETAVRLLRGLQLKLVAVRMRPQDLEPLS